MLFMRTNNTYVPITRAHKPGGAATQRQLSVDVQVPLESPRGLRKGHAAHTYEGTRYELAAGIRAIHTLRKQPPTTNLATAREQRSYQSFKSLVRMYAGQPVWLSLNV